MGLSNLSVRARLFLTLALLATALLIVGLHGLSALKQSNASLESVYGNRLMSALWVDQIGALSRDNALALDEALLSNNPAELTQFRTQAQNNLKVIEDLWSKYDPLPTGPGESEQAQKVKQVLETYRSVRNSIADDIAAGNIDQARKRRAGELKTPIQSMIVEIDKLSAMQDKFAAELDADAKSSYTRAMMVSWGAIALGIGIAGVFGWLLVSSMMSALNTAVRVAERIATGDLGQEFEINSRDEFGRLLGALRDMDAKLSEIVGTVRVSSDAVGAAARQISNGNDDLSQRTQEQASALEETASSMEEMTATVKQNADNARQASQLATSARDQADRGGTVVGRAVGAMSEINESSRRIADIIDVIDEIAFQTNLLALNAAVEAARAGEQGRGFAVVATEVRNLAQRSATAAKEIKDLISDSVGKVKTGAELVDESGKSLEEIVASVKKVADIVAEISAASEEQAAGIDQVNTAVTQMDSATQQNAALVEEASAASKSMEHQAQVLVEKVGFFRLSRGQSLAPAAEVSASAPVSHSAATVRPLPKRKPMAARKATPPAASSAPRMAKASGDDSSWQEF